ncbi:hypothetical protein PSHT_06505 [Puccinia striiformis]|uniref:GCM domain-containing protein n=1 Tax=Puccinia striiformis TaxID=27350 RepID=A0A2S4W5Z0_9BASI|nr:hypothetical protein PSHT_06505 [Puccinia striiformis]
MARAKKRKPAPLLVPHSPPATAIKSKNVKANEEIPQPEVQTQGPPAATETNKWKVPLGMDRDYRTFIDHDTTLDKQGYPLFPNRSTIWVHLADSPKIKNFKKFGFPHTDNHETKKCQHWKLIRVTCLGALLCDREDCDYAGSPPDKIKELDPPCPGSAGRCPGRVYWHKCTNTKIRFDIHSSGWALLCHQGLHNHPWPTPKKPDPEAMEELANEVKKNPKATALQLKIGNANSSEQPIKSVIDIHESWLDWWAMANMANMLLPSRRPMPEDSPEGEDRLPNTTNTQESMHRVYCMFSAGKKSMLKGMVELYAFVKALERDHCNVMQGMPIRYGSQLKKQVDVSQSIGWVKPTKRQRAATREYAEKNDGRPPDTTAGLLGESTRPIKRAKMGRPANSGNIDKNPYTTFVSYASSTNPKLRYRCWLAAALESLYALYSPLWLKESDGKKNDLFNTVVNHFTTRTTYEMTEKGSLKLILSRGSGMIFDAIQKLLPQSSKEGDFASCDLFLETVMDAQKKHSSKVLQGLFCINLSRAFTCPRHKAPVQHPWENVQMSVLRITPSMFDHNGIGQRQAGQLITLWQSSGLNGGSGLQCKQCNVNSKKRGGCKAQKNKCKTQVTTADAKIDGYSQRIIDHFRIIDQIFY